MADPQAPGAPTFADNARAEHRAAEDYAAAEAGSRRPQPWANVLVIALCLGWSAFQLYVAYVPTNSTLVRSVHLAFALVLAYLLFPATRRGRQRAGIPWYDFVLAALAGAGALYIFVNWRGIAQRAGDILPVEMVVGVVTIVLLLEAARRALGLALTVIGAVFIGYALFGPYMPDLISHKGASLNKLVNHMYLTTEGIFGVPLGVSAGFVFLFVLFGGLLEKAGGGHYFIQVAYSALGGFRGGPAKAAVLASGLTGLISGSSIANTVTTGTFTIPLMKRVGFPDYKAAAVEVAASTNGQLMPPVMGAAAFIISEFLGISYYDVIRAAFIPAVVSYVALFYIIHLESLKLGIKGIPRTELPVFWKTFASGLHFLLPVFVLIYFLLWVRFSPANSAFYAVLVQAGLMLVQHPIEALARGRNGELGAAFRRGLFELYEGLVAGARNMIGIGVATAAAGIIVGTITLTGVGQVFTEVIEALSGGSLVLVLVLTAVASLVLGMGLPTTANYIVMASLTAPVILTLGASHGLIIPAIAAHLFVFYFGILADDTPPVGLAAYAAAAIARSDPIRTGIQGFIYDMRTAILPFMFLFNTSLLLIDGVAPGGAYIWITEWYMIVIIFCSAVLAMFAFASMVQGYFLVRNRWWESLLFGLAAAVMFRPGYFAELGGLALEELMYLVGLALFAFVYLLQRRRRAAMATATA